jgi:GT2 family glycosyltransferase
MACVQSLLAARLAPEQLIVVDNASTDATCAIVGEMAGVQLMRNAGNLGFAAGNNVAIRRLLATDVRYVMLVNQDVRVEPDCLACLLDAARLKGPGLFAPVQLTYNGEQLDASMRDGILTRTASFVEDLWQGRIADAYEIPVAYGGALLIDRVVLETIGLFDECYFLYGEDEDLCRRAVRAGYPIWLIPAARVRHWHTLVQKEYDSTFESAAHVRRARIITALKNPGRRWLSRLASVALDLTSDLLHALARGDWRAASHTLQDGIWTLRHAACVKRSRDDERARFARSAAP